MARRLHQSLGRANSIPPEVLVEALPLVAYAADPAGRVTRVNRRWLEYTGLDFNESLGLSGTDAIHPDDLSAVLEAWGHALRQLEPYELEYRLRRADGAFRWHLGRAEPIFGPSGAALGWIGTATDVHDTLLKAQSLLAHSPQAGVDTVAAQLEAMLYHLPIGLAFFDRDLRYVRVNPELARMNDTSVEAHLGRTLEEVLPDTAHLLRPRIEQVFSSGQGEYGAEVSALMPRDAGDLRHALVSWFPVLLSEDIALVGASVLDITRRKNAEESLRRSEERLRLGMHIADFALAEVDYGSDTIRFSSQGASLYGLGSEDVTVSRARVHEMFHSEDRVWLEATIATALDPNGSGLMICEHRVVHPSGEVRWLNVRKQIMFDRSHHPAKPSYALLAAQDITARKHREFNLAFVADIHGLLARLRLEDEMRRIVGERLTAFLGLKQLLFIEIDLSERQATVFYEQHQSNESGMLGIYPLDTYLIPEELQRLERGEVNAVFDVRDETRSDEQALAFEGLGIRALVTVPHLSGGRWRFAFSAQHDHPYHWREDELELLRELAAHFFPRLERARAEAALHQREERYRTFFHAVDEGFCVCEMLFDEAGNPVDYRFLEVNPRFEQHTGLLNAVGRTARELVPQLEQSWIDLYAGVIRTGEPIHFEQGSEAMGRWFEGYACRVGDRHSRHFALTFKDVTEQRQSVQRLRDVNEAQRRFVSDAAHELRAPLTSIRGNVELLIRYPDILEAERLEMLADAGREASRLTRLITDLLAVARGETQNALVLSGVRFDRLLEEVWRSARSLSERHRFELAQLEACRVSGDPDALKQLVLALLENAVKYTPPDGIIGLQAHVDGSMIEVWVSDTGPGIAPEERERVFDRFYRTDRARSRANGPAGTGLGLTIVRQITERHGGSVHLEEAPGGGTRAVVRLPIESDLE